MSTPITATGHSYPIPQQITSAYERFTDEEAYEVDRILAKKVVFARGRPRSDGTRQTVTKYLVRWNGQGRRL